MVPHTAEARLQAAKDVEDFQEDGKAKPKSGKPKKEPRKLVGDDGRILQCNEVCHYLMAVALAKDANQF